MIRRSCSTLLFLAFLAWGATATAQGLAGYPSAVQFGAGAAVPVAGASDASGPGWDVSVGGDVEFRPGLAWRVDYLYGRFAAEEVEVRAQSVPSLPPRFATLRGKTQAHIGTLDLMWIRPWGSGRGSFHVFGGPAIALRRVTLTSTRRDGGSAFNESPVDVCEPQWFECSDAVVPYHQVLGIRRSVDLGLNAGAGVTFDAGLNARLFVEGRCVFLDGPSFRGASGTSRSANAMYVPLSAGIRFRWQ